MSKEADTNTKNAILEALSYDVPVVDLTGNAPLVPVSPQELAIKEQHSKAMVSIAESLATLTSFISGGGLTEVIGGLVKAQAINGVIQGLTSNAGRMGLDARTHKQNAVDAIAFIEIAHKLYKEKLQETGPRADEVVDAEAQEGPRSVREYLAQQAAKDGQEEKP